MIRLLVVAALLASVPPLTACGTADLRDVDAPVSELYPCDAEPPIVEGRVRCHVSLLVSGASGARVVMDNGAVLAPAATGGVAFYPRFVALAAPGGRRAR